MTKTRRVARHRQPATPITPRRRTFLAVELLEDRTLLDASLPAGVIPITWNDQPLYAVAGQWMVRVDGITGPVQDQVQTAQKLFDGTALPVRVTEQLGADGMFLVEAPADMGFNLLKGLEAVAGFRYMEPNFYNVHAVDDTIPNDTNFPLEYGMLNTGQTIQGQAGVPGADISATRAWDLTTGSRSVVVADIDTGIDYTHPDLYQNIWVNQAEIPTLAAAPGTGLGSRQANLVDEDGDGLITLYDLNYTPNGVDYPNQGPGKITHAGGGHTITAADLLAPMVTTTIGGTVYDTGNGGWAYPGNTQDGDTAHPNDFIGWNFVSNNNTPTDVYQHGTHTSGTIGAMGNNGVGVAGVAWQTELMEVKWIADSGSGTTANAVSAVNYAIDKGAPISSNSWHVFEDSMALYDAIARGRSYNHLFVCAAGNNGFNTDTNPNWPSIYSRTLDNIISVAATDNQDAKASFSNYGLQTVQLGAPGVNVYSTFPNNNYGYDSGTSMATPHVAGVAALAKSLSPGASYLQIKQAILDGVDPDNALRTGGPTPVATGGRLNAFHTLQLMGLSVTSSTPANGAFVAAAPTSYVLNFSSAVRPSSVSADVLHVNGLPADDVVLSAGNTRATFTFASDPVAGQGLQTLSLAAGAVVRDSDGDPVRAYNASFYYDVIRMAIDAITPAAGSTLTLPVTTLNLDAHFTEPFDPASVSGANVNVSVGSVVSATIIDEQTVRYVLDLTGVISEGTLAVNFAAGALTDLYGNPMLAYSATYSLDLGVISLPATMTAVNPKGSLVYQGQTIPFVITPDDIEGFTLAADPGETLTVLIRPTGTTLQPVVQLLDPSGNPVGSATAPAAGQEAVLQTVAVSLGGAYTIQVSGAAGTTGGYTVQVYLNAAVEAEEHGGPRNDTLATAQDLEPAFLPLTTSADRAAVVGTTDGSTSYTASVVMPTFEDISATGTGVLQGTDDVSVQLTAAQLAGFTFPFFGTTYNTLFISTNALISFGTGDTAYFNTDLTTSPTEPVIAPLWTDYVTFNPSSVVYWQVVGTGASRHLVLEWKNVEFYPGGGGFSTFEAVLNLDGSIQFNYSTLRDGGVRGTAGLKAAGAQGPNRLLLVFNNGPNAFVGNNLSTLILPPGPSTPDFYSFHLNAGQSATAALKVLTTANVTLELEDANGTTLATGRSGATNLDRVLNNFVAPADGAYYLRVIGATGADGHKDYDLVVTRNADFDTEPNNTLATAQDISGTTGALGHVGGAGNADDYYSANAVARETLTFQTRTPGDGPGGFGNVLAPHLELYDPSGTLVATGTVLPDGRNEILAYTVLDGADGLYVIRVAAEGGTQGEYVLDYQTSIGPSPRPPAPSLPPDNGPGRAHAKVALALGAAVGIRGPQSIPGVGRVVSTEVVPVAVGTGLSTTVGGNGAAVVWGSADIRRRHILDEVFATEPYTNADLDSLLAAQLGQSIPKRKWPALRKAVQELPAVRFEDLTS